MTSKLTRDRLAEIAQFGFSSAIKPANDFEIKELARLALAAMESEPHTDDELSNLLWYSQEATCHSDPNYYCEFQRLATPGLIAGIIRELQERRKAERDCELVILYRQVNPVNGMKTYWAELDPEEFRHLKQHTDENAEFITLYRHAQPAPVVPENCVTAEHRRVIEMLLNVCGAAFELADDSCQQDVDGEECHVVPSDAFQKLSDALDEIENTLPTEDIDRPDVFLAWSAMPRAALKSLLHAQPAPDYFASLVAAARVRADKAIRKFHQPNYVLNKVAEESGEVIKAVIHYTEGREEWSNVEAEIIDNLAMLLRLVKEGDQVIGFTPPVSCRAAMLAATPQEVK
ncbi:hypothetical protein LNO01_08520 [Klebsiella pneumoniae subsp. pneumoniae]|uniref:hypothetical protein n=1 Tax=Klebsiella pneumoniae TaxID=573 RepID=UPI00217E1C8A|nr:hypothetical protein [Klebsiella pneumoniae]MCS6004196.1 hypothetical protein [Klebsiella pneumoniae subsp. pneumoniae]